MIPPVPPDIRKLLGEVRSSYATPSLIGMFAAAGFLLILVACITNTGHFDIVVAIGCSFLSFAAGTFIYALRHPHLLRSDRTRALIETLPWLGSDEITDTSKILIGEALHHYLSPADRERIEGPEQRKRVGGYPSLSEETDND